MNNNMNNNKNNLNHNDPIEDEPKLSLIELEAERKCLQEAYNVISYRIKNLNILINIVQQLRK